jgi:hypothetical protein
MAHYCQFLFSLLLLLLLVGSWCLPGWKFRKIIDAAKNAWSESVRLMTYKLHYRSLIDGGTSPYRHTKSLLRTVIDSLARKRARVPLLFLC